MNHHNIVTIPNLLAYNINSERTAAQLQQIDADYEINTELCSVIKHRTIH